MGTGGSLRLLSPEIWGCQGGRSASARPFGRTPLRAFPGRAAAFALAPARFRFPCLAPSKPHRFGSLRLTDHVCLRFPSTFPLPLPLRSCSASAPLLTNPFRVRLRSLVPFQPSALAFAPPSGFSCSLLPFSLSPFLSPRSSPRPISITKLHTLPHFHR